MFICRERWGLSPRGWALMLLLIVIFALAFILNIHSFLAVTDPVNTNILVVEGWVHDFGVKAAVQEFKAGHYERVFTTGGPEEGVGPSSAIVDTDAYQSAELLVKAGIPAAKLQSVPSCFVGRDRTYNSAITLRNWFTNNNMFVKNFNILTEDAHARRTRLLFQEAFGSNVQVGIISAPDPDYDTNHWWRSSEGVREVIDETVAYIYAKFLFWPGKE